MENSCMKVFKRFALSIMMLGPFLGTTTLAAASRPAVELPDHIPTKAIQNSALLHRLDAEDDVSLTFVLPLRNRQELKELIDRLYDPTDLEHYGKYLTSAEFVERFAPSQEDYDKVAAYAKGVGLTVHGLHPNRLLMNVKGKAHKVESAFNLRLHKYLSSNGRQFHAPNKNPKVPSSIASIISGIVGLNNSAKSHTYHRRKEAIHSLDEGAQLFPSGPRGFSPGDLVAAYNLSDIPTKGSNQIIAMFELASYQESDIDTYASYFGLPSPKLTNILVDGGSGTGIDPEVTLDIELALALAPESEIYVYEGPNNAQGSLDTYNRIATDNLAKQISVSWGMGEDLADPQTIQAENAIFQQMAAQGQTIYVAAGDSGACDDYPQTNSENISVDDPASQPYVVSVGGTTLRVDPETGAYQSEFVWNDGLGTGGAGGGGVSTIWEIPSWQVNVPTVYSKTHRNVPDVALNADTNTGYAIYHDGQWQMVGGTSCAAPLWAAFTSCVNQALAEANLPPLGFANPKLYSIGIGGAYGKDFHDVTIGDNLYYKAVIGYDNASGWGSFNGANLYMSLTNGGPSSEVVSAETLPVEESALEVLEDETTSF